MKVQQYYYVNKRLIFQIIRYNSTKVSQPPKPQDSQVNDEVTQKYSAMADRFQQILDNKLANSSPSLINTDPTLNKLFNKYLEKVDPEAKSYLKSEPLLQTNRHAKLIYETQPWKGKESNADANLRMIIDSTPKIKKLPKKNLADIKESALDYQLNDKSPPKDNFRELYRERLLGPSMLMSSSPSTDLIGSVASAKINAHIDQTTGTFNTPEMTGVRGKPLSKEHLQNCTDSNYFMNHILNSQEVLPPWVESQLTLSGQISQFKKDLDDIWFKWIINKSPLSTTIHMKNSTVVDILQKFESKFTSSYIYTLPSSDLSYLDERITAINNSIRSYNLQSPASHLHKFKLVPQKEINQSYLRTIQLFSSKFVDWFEKNKGKKSSTQVLVNDRSNGGLLNLWGGGVGGSANEATIEVPVRKLDTKLHLWKAVKDIFTK